MLLSSCKDLSAALRSSAFLRFASEERFESSLARRIEVMLSQQRLGVLDLRWSVFHLVRLNGDGLSSGLIAFDIVLSQAISFTRSFT